MTAEDIQWKRIEINRVEDHKYNLRFLNEVSEGTATLEIEIAGESTEPGFAGLRPHDVAVAKQLRRQFGCDTMLVIPDNDPPRVCFLHGDKPWKHSNEQ